MKRIFALLLLASPLPAVTGLAIGQEVKYITPEIPTEQEKIDALKLAYELNGNSMVRSTGAGNIDLSGPARLPAPESRSHHPADQTTREENRAMTWQAERMMSPAQFRWYIKALGMSQAAASASSASPNEPRAGSPAARPKCQRRWCCCCARSTTTAINLWYLSGIRTEIDLVPRTI